MDAFDRQIVQFFVQWAPFGGPPVEDVLPRFGLTPHLLARRFRHIVSSLTEAGSMLDDDDMKLLAAARRVVLPPSDAVPGNTTPSNGRPCRMRVHDKDRPSQPHGFDKVPSKLRAYDRRPFRQR